MRAKGLDKHLRRMRKLARIASDPELTAGVQEAAEAVSAEAQNSITRGAVSGKNHIPSAPGQPPNEDTGFLRSKISVARTGFLSAEIRSEAEYASALEFGSSKVAARPYLRPARDKMLPEAQRIFSRSVRRAIKKSGK